MAIPFYDETNLPCITFPMENVHSQSKRYLSNKALTGKVYATMNIIAKTDADMNALHTFWRVDCNYGLEPFILSVPLFGMSPSSVEFLTQFLGDFVVTKVDNHWTAKIKVAIKTPMMFVKDDAGERITDDNGDYIFTDSSLHPSTDNIISYIRYDDIVL